MGWFSRRRRPGTSAERRLTSEVLDEWVAEHRGVEAFVEPRTTVTDNTLLLVAHDGEFIRRTVASPQVAQQFARKHGIPVYDATVVGYPQRMRDFSRRQTLLAQRAERERRDGATG